jgi:hypothetical protein
MGVTTVGDAGSLYQPAPEALRDSIFETDLPAAQDILQPLSPLCIQPGFKLAMAVRFTRQLEREGCDDARAIRVASRLAGLEIDWVEFDEEYGINGKGTK